MFAIKYESKEVLDSVGTDFYVEDLLDAGNKETRLHSCIRRPDLSKLQRIFQNVSKRPLSSSVYVL